MTSYVSVLNDTIIGIGYPDNSDSSFNSLISTFKVHSIQYANARNKLQYFLQIF